MKFIGREQEIGGLGDWSLAFMGGLLRKTLEKHVLAVYNTSTPYKSPKYHFLYIFWRFIANTCTTCKFCKS